LFFPVKLDKGKNKETNDFHIDREQSPQIDTKEKKNQENFCSCHAKILH
jgi:hypothetical protein